MSRNKGTYFEIDQASRQNFKKNMGKLQKNGDRSFFAALVKFANAIRNYATLKLQSDDHIVTSRLKNSIYVQGIKQNEVNKNLKQKDNYTDNKGASFSAKMTTIHPRDKELFVGTNVEYAEKIELIDSFLYWAMKNADASVPIQKLMKEEIEKRNLTK